MVIFSSLYLTAPFNKQINYMVLEHILKIQKPYRCRFYRHLEKLKEDLQNIITTYKIKNLVIVSGSVKNRRRSCS